MGITRVQHSEISGSNNGFPDRLKQNPSVDTSAFIGETNNVDESLYRGVGID